MIPRALDRSYRRVLLDTELERRAEALAGRVLEIGAKRVLRGRWRPPVHRVRRWLRLNLEPAERPDVVADAVRLPVRDAAMDWVVCVEVLQYATSPPAAAREIARVLVPGGGVLIAVPFLHRADSPADRHRFTETGVRELLEGGGLVVVDVVAQGLFFLALANQVRQAVTAVRRRPLRWLVGAGVLPIARLLAWADRLAPVRRSAFFRSFTTGFVVVARKGSNP